MSQADDRLSPASCGTVRRRQLRRSRSRGLLLAGVREKDVTGLDTRYVFVP
jgi:hypothetical protein